MSMAATTMAASGQLSGRHWAVLVAAVHNDLNPGGDLPNRDGARSKQPGSQSSADDVYGRPAAADTADPMPLSQQPRQHRPSSTQTVLDGIRQERFYIFTRPGLTARKITPRHARDAGESALLTFFVEPGSTNQR
jgi:hypothetical protein